MDSDSNARQNPSRVQGILNPLSHLGWTVWGYLGVLIATELCRVYVDPMVGIALDAVILLALLIHGTRAVKESERVLLWGLALAPIIRLESVSLPLNTIFPLYRYVVISVPVCAAAVLAARAMRYSPADLGLTVRLSGLPLAILMIPLGFLLGLLDYLILRPTALTPRLTLADLWLPIVILGVSTGLAEELVFRGLLQRAAVAHLGPVGIVYVAFLYTSMTIGALSGLHLLLVFGASLTFGWVVSRTGSLLGASLGHTALNVSLFLIAPFGSKLLMDSPLRLATLLVALVLVCALAVLVATFLPAGAFHFGRPSDTVPHPPSTTLSESRTRI